MANRYKLEFYITIFTGMVLLCLFIKLVRVLDFSSLKSGFTEVKGVVIDKYGVEVKEYGEHIETRTEYYLNARYTDNQEEKIAEGLKANFWETTGSTIKLYITPNGNVVRNVGIDDDFVYLVLYLVLPIGYFIIRAVRKRQKINPHEAMPVGTVIDDYDFIMDEQNVKEDNIAGQNTVNEVNQGTQAESGPLKMPSAKPSFELYTEEEYRNRKRNQGH